MPTIPGTEKLTPTFRRKVDEMAVRLGANPEDLLSVMSFETGGSFAPGERNRAGSGATGLIQFMPSTAAGMGTNTEALARMTPEQQLDVVEHYFQPYKGRLGSLKDTYMAVLYPEAIGKPETATLFSQGTRAYTQNQGLDQDRKGRVTVGDAVNAVLRFVGLAPSTVEAATLSDPMTREMVRVRAQKDDDLTLAYLDGKNADIDARMQQMRQRLQAQHPTAAPASPMVEAVAGIQPLQPRGAETVQRRTTFDPTGMAPSGISVGDRLSADALQVLGGARDAFVETMQALNLAGDWMREHGIGPAGTLTVNVPEVPQADTAEGSLIRSATQFLTAFIPATTAVKAIGVTGAITRGMAAGALTDFLAFDPQSPRVSNLINDLAPELRNPITEYLAAQPDDSEAEGRFKNTLEGLGLGAMADGLVTTVRVLRAAGGLRQEVGGAMEQGLREGATPPTGGAVRPDVPPATDAAPTQAGTAATLPLTARIVEAPAVTVGTRQRTDEEIAQALRTTGTPTTVRVSATTAEAIETRLADAPAVTIETPSAIGREQAQQFQSLTVSGAAEAIPTEGRALHINFDRIQTGEDVKQTIATVAEVVKAETEAQRRGTMSIAEIQARAAQSPYQELDRILELTPGTALNAEDAHAVRTVWLASAQRLHTLSQQLAKGDLGVADDWLKQFILTANIHPKAAGVTAEAGRALRIFGVDLPSTEREFLQQLQAILTATPSGEMDLFRSVGAAGASQNMQRMAMQIAQLMTPQQLALLMTQAHKATKGDIFTELWYGALLSSPPTQVVNALDSALRVAWAIPERYLAVGMGDVSLGEANHLVYGMRQGLQEAWGYAANAFRTGRSQFGDLGKIPTIVEPAITAARFGLEDTLIGGVVDLLGAAIRLPGRTLMAADEWFKVVNYRMELHAQAYRQAVSEGLTGTPLAQRIVALTTDPSEELMGKASAWANYQTLGQPLNEAGGAFESLGKVAQKVVESTDEWLPLKVVIPFVRTPFNVARSAAERTPLGLLSRNIQKDLVAGGAEGALARSKMALGTTMLGLFSWMALEGTITGRKPSDPALAATWERLGMQEYSIKVPGTDTYVAYNRLDAFGLPMGLAADFAMAARELPVQRLDQMAGSMLGAIWYNLTSKTYLKGVADIIEAITPGRGEQAGQSGADFSQYVRGLVSRVVPSGFATTARMLDPIQRESRTMMDAVLARLPGFSTLAPARLDLWGRPRLNAEPVGPDLLSPFMSREYTPDAVDNELLRLKVPLKMPERVIRIMQPDGQESQPFELTPQQYARYVELSAGLGSNSTPLKDTLQQLMQSDAYQKGGLSAIGKGNLVQDVVEGYRKVARAKLRLEDPEVDKLLQEKALARALSQTEAGQAEMVRRGIGVR